MMTLRLACATCALDAVHRRRESQQEIVEVLCTVPTAGPRDDGIYQVTCDQGHTTRPLVDNVKYELLFELGLNGLVDGYPREAIASFASALERFYEFFWHAVAEHHAIPATEISAAWKNASKQSERQLGMFITAYLLLTKCSPPILNPNKEVRLRNEVVHGGQIPEITAATDFGNSVMTLINNALAILRTTAPGAIEAAYARLSPATGVKETGAEVVLITNILTAVDARHPPTHPEDVRNSALEQQFARVLAGRQPHRMTLHTNNPLEGTEK